MKKHLFTLSIVVSVAVSLGLLTRMPHLQAQTKPAYQAGPRANGSELTLARRQDSPDRSFVMTEAQRQEANRERERRIKQRRARLAACPGAPINGVYNMLGYPRCFLETNDWPRIDRAIGDAIADAGGGIVFFPAGEYLVDNPFVLPSGITIQGSNNLDNAACIIRLTVANKNVFEIPEARIHITIKDIALVADTKTGTKAIWAHGGSGTDTRGNPSFACIFSNLQITEFGKGIHVDATNTIKDWQFDGIRLENSMFRGCDVNFELDSVDTSWHVTNSSFLSGIGKTAVKLTHSGWVSFFNVLGGGAIDPESEPGQCMDGENFVRAATFIDIGAHGGINIQSSASEGFCKSINVSFPSRDNVITLINNRLQEVIDLTQTSHVTSVGNVFSPGRVIVGTTNGTQVYSFGDRFCANGVGCSHGDFVNPSGNVVNVTFRTGEYQRAYNNGVDAPSNEEYIGSSTNNPMKFYDYVRVESAAGDSYQGRKDPDGSGLLPLFTISSGTNNDRPLFRLGMGAYFYTLARDGSDGLLNFEGNQSPYVGYRFKTTSTASQNVTINNGGSITIGSSNFLNLGSPLNGTLMYCSDCAQANPCTGSGSGALAKRLNNIWVCN